MPFIKLQTAIKADIRIAFDLSRSIDLHKISTKKTQEQAIAGVTNGLIGMGERVTWRAKHFGIYQRFTSQITAFDQPYKFTDEMVSGAFKEFKHEHHFFKSGETTLMTDILQYQSPLGILGTLANTLFLNKYLTEFLKDRNQTIKAYAEGEKWKIILPNATYPTIKTGLNKNENKE